MSKKHKRNIFGKNYKLLEMKRLFLYDYRYEVACMKWIIAILIGLLAFMPAVAEEASGTVYVLEYSQEGMENWAARESLEEEDVLLSLYCETSPADAQVRLAYLDSAKDTKEYLAGWVTGQSGAMLIHDVREIQEWTSPWGARGSQLEYGYVYISGTYISSSYRRKVYIAPYGGDTYLEFVLTVGNDNESGAIEQFEEEFLKRLISLNKIQYTDKIYAYLEDAKQVGNSGLVSVDTYIKEGGNEASEETIYNNDPSLIEYSIAEDAHVWIVSPNKTMGWEKIKPDAAELSMHISEYVLTNKEFPPFVFYIDGNEIVWMEQTIEAT